MGHEVHAAHLPVRKRREGVDEALQVRELDRARHPVELLVVGGDLEVDDLLGVPIAR